MAYALAVRRSPQPHDLHYSRHSPWLGRSAARIPRCRSSRSLGTTIAPVFTDHGGSTTRQDMAKPIFSKTMRLWGRRRRDWPLRALDAKCAFHGKSVDDIDSKRMLIRLEMNTSSSPHFAGVSQFGDENPATNGLTHKSARHVAAYATT